MERAVLRDKEAVRVTIRAAFTFEERTGGLFQRRLKPGKQWPLSDRSFLSQSSGGRRTDPRNAQRTKAQAPWLRLDWVCPSGAVVEIALQVPKYYFHYSGAGYDVVKDDEGAELPNDFAAMQYAMRVARDLLAELIADGEEIDDQRIDVVEDARAVGSVFLRDAIGSERH